MDQGYIQFACRTFVSISSIPKTIALGTSVKSRQLRKQFCAPLARATFHTAWVIFGSPRLRSQGLLCPPRRTSSAGLARSDAPPQAGERTFAPHGIWLLVARVQRDRVIPGSYWPTNHRALYPRRSNAAHRPQATTHSSFQRGRHGRHRPTWVRRTRLGHGRSCMRRSRAGLRPRGPRSRAPAPELRSALTGFATARRSFNLVISFSR